MIGPLDLCIEFAAILDEAQIPYAPGGSLASSMLGEPRATMDIDVAVFVLGDTLLDRWQIERRISVEVRSDERLWVTAPDVLILRKLDWFRQGESDLQWRDVVGLLTVQRDELDLVALRAQAEQVGLGRLLADAIADADSTS